jgi:hypothetical protein
MAGVHRGIILTIITLGTPPRLRPSPQTCRPKTEGGEIGMVSPDSGMGTKEARTTAGFLPTNDSSELNKD